MRPIALEVLLGGNEFDNLRRDPNPRITIPYSTCSSRNLVFLGHASSDVVPSSPPTTGYGKEKCEKEIAASGCLVAAYPKECKNPLEYWVFCTLAFALKDDTISVDSPNLWVSIKSMLSCIATQSLM